MNLRNTTHPLVGLDTLDALYRTFTASDSLPRRSVAAEQGLRPFLSPHEGRALTYGATLLRRLQDCGPERYDDVFVRETAGAVAGHLRMVSPRFRTLQPLWAGHTGWLAAQLSIAPMASLMGTHISSDEKAKKLTRHLLYNLAQATYLTTHLSNDTLQFIRELTGREVDIFGERFEMLSPFASLEADVFIKAVMKQIDGHSLPHQTAPEDVEQKRRLVEIKRYLAWRNSALAGRLFAAFARALRPLARQHIEESDSIKLMLRHSELTHCSFEAIMLKTFADVDLEHLTAIAANKVQEFDDACRSAAGFARDSREDA